MAKSRINQQDYRFVIHEQAQTKKMIPNGSQAASQDERIEPRSGDELRTKGSFVVGRVGTQSVDLLKDPPWTAERQEHQ